MALVGSRNDILLYSLKSLRANVEVLHADLLLAGGLPFEQATLHVCVYSSTLRFASHSSHSSHRCIYLAPHASSAFEFRMGEDRAQFNRSNSLG